MHLCFVDESGTPAKPDKQLPRFFVTAGLIIPEERWSDMRLKLLGLKRAHKYFGEVKWRYFAPKNDDADNPMKQWSGEQRNEFRHGIFKIITEQKSVKIIACVSDAPLAYALGNVNTQEDLYFRTYKPVTERFQYFLQDITRESGRRTNGIIVADHRGKGDDNRLRIQHERLVRESGKYTSTYANFIEGLFFSPSHMSIGIQLVDMVAGAIWRRFEHNDSFWFDVIRPSFRQSRNGKISGFGLVYFPTTGWTGPVVD